MGNYVMMIKIIIRMRIRIRIENAESKNNERYIDIFVLVKKGVGTLVLPEVSVNHCSFSNAVPGQTLNIYKYTDTHIVTL